MSPSRSSWGQSSAYFDVTRWWPGWGRPLSLSNFLQCQVKKLIEKREYFVFLSHVLSFFFRYMNLHARKRIVFVKFSSFVFILNIVYQIDTVYLIYTYCFKLAFEVFGILIWKISTVCYLMYVIIYFGLYTWFL